MPVTEEDVFASMQQELEYESHLNEARRLLKTAESDPSFYDRAILEVSVARRFLAPGASPSDLDAIVDAVNTGKEQVERDRRESERREAERLRKEAEERRRAEEKAAERARQRELEDAENRRRMGLVVKWTLGIVGAILLIGWLGPGLFFAILGGIIALFVIALIM